MGRAKTAECSSAGRTPPRAGSNRECSGLRILEAVYWCGWYLKADKSVAVGEDGKFYILTAPLTLAQRLRGVKPEPSPPTLILGKGGRDGEQIDLTEALTMRIPTWAEG